MARAIGLDIGGRTVKVVELSGTGKSFKIQRLAIREIEAPEPPAPEEEEAPEAAIIQTDDEVQVPEDEPEEEEFVEVENPVVGILKDLFKKLQLPKEDTCASFPSGITIFREITVPFFEEDQIRKVVRFEAENHLHSHAIEDVVVNWIKTGETKDGSRLTIFASPKLHLAERIGVMRRAGIDAASVDLDSTALYTALDAGGVFEEQPNVIVIDVGATTTNLMLVVDGRPRMMRSFLLGVGNLESTLDLELGVGATESRQAAIAAGGEAEDLFVPAAQLEPENPEAPETEKSLTQLKTDVVADGRHEFVTKLYREAYRSLMSVSTDAPPEKILLAGGGSLLPGVPESLSERFGLPVEPLDLFDHIECKDKGPDPRYAAVSIGPAVGCALRMLGRNPLGVELLQDEFAPRNMFEVIRTALATTVTLLFLVLGVHTYATKQKLTAEKIKYNYRLGAVHAMFKDAESAYQEDIMKKKPSDAQRITVAYMNGLPKDANRINSMRSMLLRRHRELQKKLGIEGDVPELRSALEVAKEIYAALSIPKREDLGEWFQIRKMDIGLRRVTMELIVSDRNIGDKVRDLLQNSAYLKKHKRRDKRLVEAGEVKSHGRTDYAKMTFTINLEEN